MSEHRSDKNRAFNKESTKKETVQVSHYVEDARPGKTLYAYICPFKGIIRDFSIYVGRLSEGEAMPINIELEAGKAKMEMNRSLSIGKNPIDSFKVEAEDLLFVKCRDMIDSQFRSSVITISFKVTTR